MPSPTAPKTLLHLASGTSPLPKGLPVQGWRILRWDIDPASGPDHVGGLPNLRPLADASVDALFASHQLPLLASAAVPRALAECLRVLRPGGVAWLVVPDLEALAPHIAQGDLHRPLFKTAESSTTASDLLWGPQAAPFGAANSAPFRTGFVAATLQQSLLQAGFEDIAIQRDPMRFEMMARAKRPAQPAPPAQPDSNAADLFERGRQLHAAGQWAQAEGLYQQALQLNPTLWPAWFEWGVACFAQGRLPEAIAHVREALGIEPRYARGQAALGTFLGMAGQPAEAVTCLQRAAELEPGSAEGHYNLGKAWQDLNAFSAAEDAYRHALKLDTGHALAQLNLGKVLNEQAQTREGLALYREATPHLADPTLRSSLPMLLNFVDNASDTEVYEAHRVFDRRFAAPLKPPIRPKPSDGNPHRRLRLGYLSRDFRQHSLRYFLLPILRHHDHAQFEVVGYCDNDQTDGVTAQYRALCDRWVDCHAWDDNTLAQRITQDGIDVLVDLAGHTNRNRLLVLARQPAPVQVTYLGYPATTGVQAIDYRISDRWIDPEPDADAGTPRIDSAETPMRLQHGYFCYQPMADSPPVGSCPFERNGCITFGSMNQGSKLTPLLLLQWVQLLKELPAARLCVQNAALHEPRARQRLAATFVEHGIDARRLSFRPFAPAPTYLQTYHDIDIALDSYPYNGGTTTCEALWMGVPVVSWCGTRHVGRLGASILHTLQLGDLVATTPQAYVQAACQLAASPTRLRNLRSTLRERMQASPLMDHAGCTRELEGAWRAAWLRACA